MAWAEEVAEVLDRVGDTAYDEGFGPLTVTVPADRWSKALMLARDSLGCAFFDWLSAVDELSEGFAVVCHLARLGSSAMARGESPEEPQTNRAVAGVEHLLVRTTVPRESPRLASVVEVYAGASWHERETQEMFGIRFLAPGDRTMAETEADVKDQEGRLPRHLLLPEEFEGHPLRKDFVLVSRVAKPWPGAKEPGESDEGGSPSRRRTRPPGVPDDESWGPRAPGSAAPDPLAHAQPGPARPRRAPRARPARGEENTGDKAEDDKPDGEQADG